MNISIPHIFYGTRSKKTFGTFLVAFSGLLVLLLGKDLILEFSSLLQFSVFFILSGDASPGGTGPDMSASQARSAGMNVDPIGGTYSCSNGWSGGVSDPDASCPFIKTWDGKKYIIDNDFLMGKPQTSFVDKKSGLSAYTKGIGGDTYILANNSVCTESNEIRLQISEIEPEESFIDMFSLYSLDLSPEERVVVDGDMETLRLFDLASTKTISNSVFKKKPDSLELKSVISLNNEIGNAQFGNDQVLDTNEELLINIPYKSLLPAQDTYLLVDSYFRDWILGEQVPFSSTERFLIGSVALGRSVVATAVGVSMVAVALVTSHQSSDENILKQLANVPYTYAETTTPKSLVISALIGDKIHYLQTLFPRYVQAAQEVVRIPQKLIDSLEKGQNITLSIKATKKHIVRAAFVFAGNATEPILKKLSMKSAMHSRDGKNYVQQLQSKNNIFLETIPGDTVELVFSDVHTPSEAKERKLVIKANGFYTRLSPAIKKHIGENWLDRLSNDDRKTLRHLRLR